MREGIKIKTNKIFNQVIFIYLNKNSYKYSKYSGYK